MASLGVVTQGKYTKEEAWAGRRCSSGVHPLPVDQEVPSLNMGDA
jgi:hypothetical protein